MMTHDDENDQIAEFTERDHLGEVHHVLYFDPGEGAFVLESQGFGEWDGDLSRAYLDSQEAYQWLTEVAGMEPVEAARRVVGADEDTPR